MGIIGCFVLSYFFPFFYNASWYLLYILIVFTIIDVLLLFLAKSPIEAVRETPEKLSNGDENEVIIRIKSKYTFPIYARIIDEIPFQFQVRNFNVFRRINAQSKDEYKYFLRPTERGEYFFGNLNVFASSPLRLTSKRFSFC